MKIKPNTRKWKIKEIQDIKSNICWFSNVQEFVLSLETHKVTANCIFARSLLKTQVENWSEKTYTNCPIHSCYSTCLEYIAFRSNTRNSKRYSSSYRHQPHSLHTGCDFLHIHHHHHRRAYYKTSTTVGWVVYQIPHFFLDFTVCVCGQFKQVRGYAWAMCGFLFDATLSVDSTATLFLMSK